MSSPVQSAPEAPKTKRALRRLLVSRRPEDTARLDTWIHAEPGEAVARLATLTRRIMPVNNRQKIALALVLVPFFLFGILYEITVLWLPTIKLGDKIFSLAQSIICIYWASEILNKRRSNYKAVLALARNGDIRAVRPMARLWNPRPLGRRETAFNHEIGHTLSCLLEERDGARYDDETEQALRRLVTRIFPTNRFAKILHRSADLTEENTDVLLSVVRHLAPPPQTRAAGSQPEADAAALNGIAALPRAGTHYALLNETAQSLLKNGRAGTP